MGLMSQLLTLSGLGRIRKKMSSLRANEQPRAFAEVPESQQVLLLRDKRQPYELVRDYPVSELQEEHEVLVQNVVIGLNPIDWKAPDYGFGIPQFPHISGRELAGRVVKTASAGSKFGAGDKVIAIGTDYRDPRKAAYQEYAVSSDFNLVRLPDNLSFEEGATLGVAFVAASLALGVCMGANYSSVLEGPDLFAMLRNMDQSSIPADVRSESLDSIDNRERVHPGDWIAIWGGSSTSANIAVQLSRLIGLRVVLVVDSEKHGLRLSCHKTIRPDLLVDSKDPERAIEIIRANTGGKLRFGIDTRGKDTAAFLLRCLRAKNDDNAKEAPPSPPSTPSKSDLKRSHLVGLTGIPQNKTPEESCLHQVPIKLFHEVPVLGAALCNWLERLLEKGLLSPPDIIDVEEGLGNVNHALDRMRRGEISGGKLLVRVKHD